MRVNFSYNNWRLSRFKRDIICYYVNENINKFWLNWQIFLRCFVQFRMMSTDSQNSKRFKSMQNLKWGNTVSFQSKKPYIFVGPFSAGLTHFNPFVIKFSEYAKQPAKKHRAKNFFRHPFQRLTYAHWKVFPPNRCCYTSFHFNGGT